MKLFPPPFFSACIVIFLAGVHLGAQSARDAGESTVIPLRKITIYSSGVAFFEHSGTLSGPARIKLPFKQNAVNDALKSLVLNDPASASPSITYPSEQNLWETLRSLSIDLSGSPEGDPGMAEILSRLRGEEVEVDAPGLITGRFSGRFSGRVCPPGGPDERDQPGGFLHGVERLPETG
jgi:hypothetical protein